MPSPAAKRENILVNLVCNIAIPTFVLSKLSSESRLGPVWSLIVALAFPLGYGLWDYVQRRETNFISLVGLASVLLTGGLGLLKVSVFWFWLKEAAIPSVIAAGIWLSDHSDRPLVKTLIYNPQLIDVAKVDTRLDELGKRLEFDHLIIEVSRLLVLSFLLTALLNFVLAHYFVVSQPGSPAFNAELGKMHLWSWIMITVPNLGMMMLALWKLFGGLKKLTGFEIDDLFVAPPPKEKKK